MPSVSYLIHEFLRPLHRQCDPSPPWRLEHCNDAECLITYKLWISDQRCLGYNVELDVLHSSHHYWLVLCFESSSGSPVWVSVPHLCEHFCPYYEWRQLLSYVLFFQRICEGEREGGEPEGLYETASPAAGGKRTEWLPSLDRQGRYWAAEQLYIFYYSECGEASVT